MQVREHAILTLERPSYVTLIALVRDAIARLPNGEGTPLLCVEGLTGLRDKVKFNSAGRGVCICERPLPQIITSYQWCTGPFKRWRRECSMVHYGGRV